MREYFRPNLWPNTPDILTEYLQFGGRPAFMMRFVLAATLGANYGIYGPAFELLEASAARARQRRISRFGKIPDQKLADGDSPDSLKEFIARASIEFATTTQALQSDWSLRFQNIDNEQIICYTKQTEDLDNVIVVVVNLDPHHVQSGWVKLDHRGSRSRPRASPIRRMILLTGARFLWHGVKKLRRAQSAASCRRIFFGCAGDIRREQDFDYFM